MFRLFWLLALTGLMSCSGCPAAAQTTGAVDAATREQVIERVITLMSERYVFPAMAQQVQARLRDPEQRRALAIDDATGFARALTESLQAVTKDLHLRVTWSATSVPEGRGNEPAAADLERARLEAQRTNFGVARVERLPGNIGLLELTSFTRAEWAGETIAAAMTLLAHCDALVIDLRRNGGGDPATVALLTSYLLDRRTHLNDLYFRPGDRTESFHSLDWVPGRRFGGSKPVLVLTARRTFSGAEEFSYNLQQLRRATLIGETTGGGAHPGEFRKVGEHFRMFVATGRAINPISKRNWEGTGVLPDVPVKADDALRVAQLRLLPALRDEAARRGDTGLRDALAARISELERAAG